MNPPYFLTAYEIAVKHGFRGTEEEWLISLTAFSSAQEAGFKGTVDEWLADLIDPVPNIQIGEVTTLEGGREATASFSGDKRNLKLNLGIPRGLGMVDAMPAVGGKMKGPLNMDGHAVKNIPEPVAESDPVTKKYADTKAVTENYSGIFLASGWSEEAPFTQKIVVEGILKDDPYPIVDIDLSEVEDVLPVIEGWSYVGRCTVTEDNKVTAYCYQEKPEVDMPVLFKVVR